MSYCRIFNIFRSMKSLKINLKTILSSLFLISVAFSIRAQGSCQGSVNLVVNSDFNLGNTGFTSTLGYSVNCTPGYYYVGPNMQSKCNIWPSTFVDHTTGTGNFLIVDGDNSIAPQEIWTETVSVNSGVNYTFSFWAKNLYTTFPFSLGFVINGVQVATSTTLSPTAWAQHTTTWTATMTGTVAISIRQITAHPYRDFGIDDIIFSDCNSQSIGIAPLTDLQSKIDVFPNPSTGAFIFKLQDLTGLTKINVFDLTGNLILSKDAQASSNPKIDLCGFSKGIYFAEILNNNRKIVVKLIVE